MSTTSSGPGLGTVIAVSVLTSGLVSAGVSYGFSAGLFFPSEEEVPALEGLSLDAARDMLTARGLRMVNRGERHHDTVEAGQIAEQQPGAGSMVRSDDEVSVFVSLGPDRVEVPDVTGLSLAPARARLNNVGLRPAAETVIAIGAEGRAGTVSGTTPSAGERVERESEVVLTVVPERVLIAVPDLVGQSIRRARTAITDAGLTVGETRQRFDDMRPAYVVLDQTPAAGTEVDPGAAVDLVINED